jgi:hypothetical protein
LWKIGLNLDLFEQKRAFDRLGFNENIEAA